MSNKQVPSDVPMMSITRGIRYNFDNVESQRPDPLWRGPSTKRKLGETLTSVSFWNTMFVITCVIAVSLDPLFFYIPVINEEQKCLAVDKELRTIALTLRSLTDVTFVANIIYHVCKAINDAYEVHREKKSELAWDWEFSKVSAAEIIPFAKLVAGKLAWHSTLTSILAVIPMPQLLLVFVFFKMRGHGYWEHRKILNVFLLAQYLPRIYRIYLSSHKLRQTTGIWTKALFNFFLYILASHVVGAFWYLFSVQRETSCWHRACVNNSTNVEGCMSTLYCEGHNTTARNATFLNQLCPISGEENSNTPFDFGIYLDSLKKGITGDIQFGTRLSYSFWWGLRNLSNFGTNLETSSYVWETCFAAFVSVFGLLLFLYLIGNIQTFLSMETQRREQDMRNKIQLVENDIAQWMDRNELPDKMKKVIMKNIEQKLRENKDADLENLFFILPAYTKKYLKRFLGMKLLKKVPKLARMDERVLEMMCDYLKPVMYAEGSVVLQMGDPLCSMLLITEGTLLTYRTTSDSFHVATENAKTGSISSSPSVGHLDKGDFYGAEELIEWVSQNKVLDQLPTSCFNVKCDSKVEGFVLTAKDLRSVVSKYENWWKIGISKSDHSIV